MGIGLFVVDEVVTDKRSTMLSIPRWRKIDASDRTAQRVGHDSALGGACHQTRPNTHTLSLTRRQAGRQRCALSD